LVLGAGFEDDHVEAMADAVRCRSHARDTGADDGNFGRAEAGPGARRARGEDFVKEPLEELESEEERVEDWVVYL